MALTTTVTARDCIGEKVSRGSKRVSSGRQMEEIAASLALDWREGKGGRWRWFAYFAFSIVLLLPF